VQGSAAGTSCPCIRTTGVVWWHRPGPCCSRAVGSRGWQKPRESPKSPSPRRATQLDGGPTWKACGARRRRPAKRRDCSNGARGGQNGFPRGPWWTLGAGPAYESVRTRLDRRKEMGMPGCRDGRYRHAALCGTWSMGAAGVVAAVLLAAPLAAQAAPGSVVRARQGRRGAGRVLPDSLGARIVGGHGCPVGRRVGDSARGGPAAGNG